MITRAVAEEAGKVMRNVGPQNGGTIYADGSNIGEVMFVPSSTFLILGPQPDFPSQW